MQFDDDELIPDPQICRNYKITSMTLWRWRRNSKIDYPHPIKIGERNYVPRAADNAFRQRMIMRSIEERSRNRARSPVPA